MIRPAAALALVGLGDGVFTIGLALDQHQEARAVDVLEITSMLGGTSELGMISSFGVDANAELYVVSYSHGRILKIVPERSHLGRLDP